MVERTSVPASAVPGGRPLRGRSVELGAALAALHTVRQGQPALVVLRGEPGIGKTALVRAIVEQAGRLGFHTADTAAHEDDRLAPLASIGPALRFGTAPLIDSADFMDLAAPARTAAVAGRTVGHVVGATRPGRADPARRRRRAVV